MDRIRVKICGITNFDDARVALESGADFLGFILYPKSLRYIPPEKIREVRLAIDDWMASTRMVSPQSSRSPQFVGVFVNESAERVAEILPFAGLDYAQLHGDESPDFLQQLTGQAFKAIRPVDAEDAQDAAARFATDSLDSGPQLFIDAWDPNEYGGTGKKADWHLAAALAQTYPRLMLAGGLTPANVAQAIRTVRPWAVDVSSGVEAEPGRKDHAAVRAFISAARS
ncbi:MAG: phosphoribosylanthranilate isomerase [Caldilineaceae bacterium]|nr:phosphoribosylanthranilate isomerase [Caldilineaceae bacterium]